VGEVRTITGLTFTKAFTECLDAGGGRYRNSHCPHNDGETGVWYRAIRDDSGFWPDHAVYDECGTAVALTDFLELLKSDDDTWEAEVKDGPRECS
jgi:hypothetical protein